MSYQSRSARHRDTARANRDDVDAREVRERTRRLARRLAASRRAAAFSPVLER
jgi:hypothetical protein